MRSYMIGKTFSSFISKSLIFSMTMIILLQFFLFQPLPVKSAGSETDFYFGVDVAYADLPVIKTLIDKVSSYTNLFVIGSTGITYNQGRLNETCQYLYNKDLSFIIYTEHRFQSQWFEDAKKRWGSHFLGYYVFDEPGGRQLDRSHMMVQQAENYTDAADQFVNAYDSTINEWGGYNDSTNSTVFTSDYALYWFDYKAGYDVMFAEFGWNYSRQINVALNRGAATILNKEWGVIIAWTYNNPPYIESGPDLYNDLVFAYENGAKYVLVFDSNEYYTSSILKEEHFIAMEQFWQYTQNNPRTYNQAEKRVAFVLPEGYGYGFRGPDDKIWGLWQADDLSFELSHHIGSLLEQYGTRLDIIYEDYPFNYKEQYSEIYFTNGTHYGLPRPDPPPPTENFISVYVSEVIDGDTFKTRERYTIRLADIDAPEIGEVGYLEAAEYLASLIENKTVILDIDSKTVTDQYGRYICLAYVQYTPTYFINVNQALVVRGYAIVEDYINNEFDPTIWTLYSPIEDIPEFQLFLVFPLFFIITLSAILIKNKIQKKKI